MKNRQRSRQRSDMTDSGNRLAVSRAIVVEGRDDVYAVSRACDALIIPTHGFGITAETWDIIARADREKGLIILTDPDHAGECIRKKLTERFPDAVQCRLAREDSLAGDDIGVENAEPQVIEAALRRALELSGETGKAAAVPAEQVCSADIVRLGLSGREGSAELRSAVCRELGIGWCNAKAMVTRLRGFDIGKDELEEAVRKVRKEKNI